MFISSDTNIWIDFYKIKHLDHPFLLDFEYYISSDTFQNEFIKSEPTQESLLSLGLRRTDITNAEYEQALTFDKLYPRISIYDAFALSIAKQRGWTLLTGDAPLRSAANQEAIEVHGIIWIYDQLAAQEKITVDEYYDAIDALISAQESGICRLPIKELLQRKRPG